jgi:hypothetical protein
MKQGRSNGCLLAFLLASASGLLSNAFSEEKSFSFLFSCSRSMMQSSEDQERAQGVESRRKQSRRS